MAHMTGPTVTMQAPWPQGVDHLMHWETELSDLPMHGKQHSPSSAMADTDYLGCLIDHVTEGHDIPSFPGERLPSFSEEPDVPFGTPNLEHHGIDPQLPHSDTLTHDSHIRGMSSVQGIVNIEQNMLPRIAIHQRWSSNELILINIQQSTLPRIANYQNRHSRMREIDFATHPREPHSSELRVRPHTALPAIHTNTNTFGPGQMPVIPKRPKNIHRTSSCPPNGYHHQQPMQFGARALPHEAQANQPPSFAIGREQEYRNRAARQEEEDEYPASPQTKPRGRGKGGRQKAPPPDDNMDPKKRKRIMANRESAARSKMKQKRHIETLEKERDEKVEEKNAIHEENRKRRKVCDMWQDRLQMWDELQQVRGLNAKLREFRSVLLDAMSGTPHDRLANGPCLMNHPARCLPQNGHNEAPVNVHAFSSNSMPGGPPAFKGAQGGPETPDLDMPNGSHPQLSDSYDQIMYEGSTSPSDPLPNSGHTTH